MMTARQEPFAETTTAGDRWALAAGVAFLDGAAAGTWGISGLRGWFEQHLVSPGYMRPPTVVHEPPIGEVTLWSQGAASSGAHASPEAVLSKARATVLAALRGFLAMPCDDRFVTAALFSGRVQRASISIPPSSGTGPRGASAASRWVPRHAPGAPLSALVLGVFAVDALTNREAWERSLCICDACGRVTFRENEVRRRTCPAHAPAPSTTMPRVVGPGPEPAKTERPPRSERPTQPERPAVRERG